ncbi:MAG TPA: hypothetical protein VIJ94_10775 [Caulobacteraceae bacterium]
MGGAVAIGTWLQQEPANIAKATRWTVAGPPCPAVSPRALADTVVKPGGAFQYDDVTFSRAYGHVYCDEIHDDGGRGLGSHPVCQFTGPAVLKVTTPKGSFYFAPSTGPATVAVAGDIPTCVRGGWFRGQASLF